MYEKNAVAEKRTAWRVLNRILSQGYQVRVHDGEEWASARTTTTEEAWEAMGETEKDVLVVYTAETATRIGTITLIWGNGAEELVANYGWSSSQIGAEDVMDVLANGAS